MQYNPSFSGEAGGGRLSSSAGYGYPERSTPSDLYTYHVFSSYDQFVPSLASGIGLMAGYLGQEGGIFNRDAFLLSLAVAPKFSIKGKYTLSPSLDFSTYFIHQNSSNPSDSIAIANEAHGRLFSSKVGLLFNSKKFYVGYSVKLFEQFSGKRGSYPTRAEGFKSFLQLGYTFQRKAESKFSFTPQIALIIAEGGFPITISGLNLNFRYTKWIAGINNVGVHLGYQNEKLRLMLNKSVSPGMYSSLDLSFRYIFKQADRNQGWY